MIERSIDVMLLWETRQDLDSISIRRLHADGFGVIERARPRSRRAEASLSAYHGEFAIVANAGVHMEAVDNGTQPWTFECVAARISSAMSTCFVIVIYRIELERRWECKCRIDWLTDWLISTEHVRIKQYAYHTGQIRQKPKSLPRCWRYCDIHVIATTVRSCFAALRQIRFKRRSLTHHVLLTLIGAQVVSKVDYCYSVLTGISWTGSSLT